MNPINPQHNAVVAVPQNQNVILNFIQAPENVQLQNNAVNNPEEIQIIPSIIEEPPVVPMQIGNMPDPNINLQIEATHTRLRRNALFGIIIPAASITFGIAIGGPVFVALGVAIPLAYLSTLTTDDLI